MWDWWKFIPQKDKNIVNMHDDLLVKGLSKQKRQFLNIYLQFTIIGVVYEVQLNISSTDSGPLGYKL